MPDPSILASSPMITPAAPSQTAQSSVLTARATIDGLSTGTDYSVSPFGAYIGHTPSQDILMLVGGSIWGVTISDATSHDITIVVSYTNPNGQAFTYATLFPTLAGKTKLDLDTDGPVSGQYSALATIAVKANTAVNLQCKEIVTGTNTTGVYGASLFMMQVG